MQKIFSTPLMAAFLLSISLPQASAQKPKNKPMMGWNYEDNKKNDKEWERRRAEIEEERKKEDAQRKKEEEARKLDAAECVKKITANKSFNTKFATYWCDYSASLRQVVIDQSFESCFNQVKTTGEDLFSVFALCASHSQIQATQKALANPSIVECEQSLLKAGAEDMTLMVCDHYQSQYASIVNKPGFNACVRQAVATGGMDLFVQKKQALIQRYNGLIRPYDETAYHSVMKDCLKGNPTPAPGTESAPRVTVIGHTVFVSDQKVQIEPNSKAKVALGGISGCSYSENDDLYYCVSDSKKTKLIFLFKARQDVDQFWHFDYVRSIELKTTLPKSADETKKGSTPTAPASHTEAPPAEGPPDEEYSDRYDRGGYSYQPEPSSSFEDIAVTKNGLFLSGEFDRLDAAIRTQDAEPLYQFGFNGEMIDKFPLIPDYIPKIEKVKRTFTDRVWVWYDNPAQGQPTGQYEDRSDVREVEEQTIGLRDDKGIEAMSVAPSENFIFYSSEQPLKQSNVNTLLIVKQSLKGPSSAEKFVYKLNNEANNGMSAMLALNDQELVTVERSYSFQRDKVIVRLFKVTFDMTKPNQDGSFNTKKLEIANLENLIPYLSAGFRELDNFEAIAIGPRVDRESTTLVLATDDNFMPRQSTIFLTLRIPNAIMEGKAPAIPVAPKPKTTVPAKTTKL